MAQRSFTTHPIILRRLTVTRVHDLNPRMRRVTLAGPELRAFSRDGLELPPFASPGFDDHVKLVFAEGGDLATALPVQRAHSIDWPEAPHRRGRDYTPRRFDPVAGELDLDFVRHGDGPAARWAESATIGSELHIVGPKSSLVIPDDVEWLLLAGDETALPAIGRYLDERNDNRPVQVVVELRHPDARQELALREGDTVCWIVTPDGEASALAEAVRAIEWWDGVAYAWAAAESRALLPLRRWLAKDRAVAKTHSNVTGYWHEEPAADASASSGPPAPVIDARLLLSPIPWFATRAALQLGLLDALAEGPKTRGALARELDLNEASVAPLLDYLAQIDVLAEASVLQLGAVGQEILGDEHLREEFEDSVEARMVESLAGLADALGGGESAFARTHGRSLLDEIEQDRGRFEELAEEAAGMEFVAPALLGIAAFAEASSVLVTGTASAVVAGVAEDRWVTVLETELGLESLHESLNGTRAEFTASKPLEGVELAVLAGGLEYRTDEEARALLGTLASAAPRLLVVEHVGRDNLDRLHESEHRLLALAATGSAPRSSVDIAALAGAMGWRSIGETQLGWGFAALEFEPA